MAATHSGRNLLRSRGAWSRRYSLRAFELRGRTLLLIGFGRIGKEVAARAQRFVGTIGSTFTSMIQRQRLLRDPNERFLYTADFTPDGPVFERGEFVEHRGGSYTWNRIGYAMSPDVLAWFREWPESA